MVVRTDKSKTLHAQADQSESGTDDNRDMHPGNRPRIKLARIKTKKRSTEMLYLKKAMECTRSAIVMTDAQGRDIIYHNSAFVSMFGYTPEILNAIGGLPRVFQNSRVALWLYYTIVNGESWDGELEVFTANGEMLSVALHADTVTDEAGNIIGLFGIFNNITEQMRMEAELTETRQRMTNIIDSLPDASSLLKLQGQVKQAEEKMAYLGMHDMLTGLYNRSRFEKEMLKYEKGPQCPIGIIMGDVDGLKLVNDTLGHQAGDGLLMAAAQVLKKSFREPEMIARVGGDEFAIILPCTGISRLERVIDRIRSEIQAYNQNNSEPPLSMSLGYAYRDNEPISVYELYKRADNYMCRKKMRSSQSARSAIVKTLIKAMEARDFYTGEHAGRLQDLLLGLAVEIDYPVAGQHDLFLFAQFHDIGKVGIPDRILLKPGPLTDAEKIEMQRHCEIGRRIALASPDLAAIADWILKHHEWWNGQGYPVGLKGLEIPLECRMLSIVDAFDAMTSDRPYRKALLHEEAMDRLTKGKGTQFDPDLVAKFTTVIAAKRAAEKQQALDASTEK